MLKVQENMSINISLQLQVEFHSGGYIWGYLSKRTLYGNFEVIHWKWQLIGLALRKQPQQNK